MLYTHMNTRRAKVVDMDSLSEIRQVLEINTKAGWVKVAQQPFTLDPQGRIASERIRFRSIYPIRGRELLPVLFHCYGRSARN